jgi:hypothetical protein
VLDEVIEMVMKLLKEGYTLQDIDRAAYEYFARRVGALPPCR